MCENFLAKMFDKIYFIFIKYMEYLFMRKVNSSTNLNEMLIYRTSYIVGLQLQLQSDILTINQRQ